MASFYVRTAGGNSNAAATYSQDTVLKAGGAASGIVPTAADDVFLVAASGNLTINAAMVCRSFSLTDGVTTFAGTITHNAAVTVSIGHSTAPPGNVALKFVSGFTYTIDNATTSAIEFIGTSGAVVDMDFAGKTTGNVTCGNSGTGGSHHRFISTHVTGATATVTCRRGTFQTNGFTMNWGLFNSNNSNTRSVELGASTINILGGATAWTMQGTTGLTFTPGTSTITLSGASVTMRHGAGATAVYNNVYFTGSGNASIGDAMTFANLRRISTAIKTDSLTIAASQTVTGTFTATGNSAINRILIQSSVLGTARNITAGVVSLTNVDFVDINGAGAAAPFTGTSLGDALGNSNITFTAATTQSWVPDASGNWSTAANWTSRVPLPQDTANISRNFTAARTISLDMPRPAKDISTAGSTGTLPRIQHTLSFAMFGSLDLTDSNATASFTNGFNIDFYGRGSHTIKTVGNVFSGSASTRIVSAGGTYTLLDNCNWGGRTFDLVMGTFDANDFDVYAGTAAANRGFTSTGTLTRTLNMGNGTWYMGGTGTIWTVVTTGLTLNAEGSTIAITGTGATKTFAGGGATYNDLAITLAGGTGGLFFTGSNTYREFNPVGSGAMTLGFAGPATHTFTGADPLFSGTAGNLITIGSSNSTNFTITAANKGILSYDYLALFRNDAAGAGTTWYAGANSTDSGLNSGWIFTAPPTSQGNFFPFF